MVLPRLVEQALQRPQQQREQRVQLGQQRAQRFVVAGAAVPGALRHLQARRCALKVADALG